MKPDYKNWVPKGMVWGFFIGAAAALLLLIIFGCTPILARGVFKTVFTVVFILAALACIVAGVWMYKLHKLFDYNGTRQLSKQIIDGVAEYAKLPDGGTGLDVGCGSGALTIACAKKNPNASMIGIDRWGKEYASFSKALCESNAAAEGVANVSFRQGDALKLDFPDETFDLVTSNYVYHNIPSKDRQAILLETLRTLKKGGTFAIHDIMSRSKYGDMEGFVKKLELMGYEDVQLIKTDNGKFMEPGEAGWMGLSGSAILYGRK
ncbi:MAG: class I SAM-dependent methyltransferase [Clostridiales bacterium]|nr:class I SAM-dependent methyltransferase [Clostridiales bacterium]